MPIDGKLEDDRTDPFAKGSFDDWPSVVKDGVTLRLGHVIVLGVRQGVLGLNYVDGFFQAQLPRTWIEHDGVLFAAPPESSNAQGPIAEALEWFQGRGILQEGVAFGLERAIVLAINRKVIKVAYSNGHFTVKLPKEWVETKIGSMFP